MARIVPLTGARGRGSRTEFGEKVRYHQKYVLEDGTKVPSSTTVTGILNKYALVSWAAELAWQGIDHAAYREAAADVGSLVHDMIRDVLVPEFTCDYTLYRPVWYPLAKVAFARFRNWLNAHDVRVLFMERPFVSEKWRFGGKPDLVCELDGYLTLIDFKTATSVYPDHFAQVASYWALLHEHGIEVQEVRILHLSRDGDDFGGSVFEEYVLGPEDLQRSWHLFKCLRAAYDDINPLRRAVRLSKLMEEADLSHEDDAASTASQVER